MEGAVGRGSENPANPTGSGAEEGPGVGPTTDPEGGDTGPVEAVVVEEEGPPPNTNAIKAGSFHAGLTDRRLAERRTAAQERRMEEKWLDRRSTSPVKRRNLMCSLHSSHTNGSNTKPGDTQGRCVTHRECPSRLNL